MNNYFEFDKKELKDFLFKNYKEDPNYKKDLDINYNLEILENEKGAEKAIKFKANGEKRKVKIKIPREIKEGQAILLIGEGRKQDNKYGNLLVTVKIK